MVFRNRISTRWAEPALWFLHLQLQFLFRHTLALYKADVFGPSSSADLGRVHLLGVSISRQKFAMSAANSFGTRKIWEPLSIMNDTALVITGDIAFSSSAGICQDNKILMCKVWNTDLHYYMINLKYKLSIPCDYHSDVQAVKNTLP